MKTKLSAEEEEEFYDETLKEFRDMWDGEQLEAHELDEEDLEALEEDNMEEEEEKDVDGEIYKVRESKTWEIVRKIQGRVTRTFRLWPVGDGDWKMQEIGHLDSDEPIRDAVFIPKKVVDIMIRERNKENLKG